MSWPSLAKVGLWCRRNTPAVMLMALGALAALPVSLMGRGIGITTDLPMLALSISALGAAIALVRLPTHVKDWPRLAAALGAWLCWALLAAIASPARYAALLGIPGSMLGWLEVALICAVVVAAARDARAGTLLGMLAPVVLAVEACVVFAQAAVGSQPGGTMSNSTYMGEIVVLLVPFAVARASRAKTFGMRLACGVAAVLGVAAVVRGDARAAMVGLSVWLALLTAMSLGQRLPLGGRRQKAAACAVVGVSLAAYSVVFGRQSLTAFIADRSRFWSAGLAALGRRPVLGWGPGGFRSGVWAIASPSTVETNSGLWQIASDPHNILVWVLVSTGIVGLLLFAWLLFEIARRWRSQTGSGAWSAQSAARAGMLMYALIGMTAPLHLQTWPLAALVLGISLGRTGAGQESAEPDRFARARRVLRVVIAVLTAGAALLLGAFAVSRLIAAPFSGQYVEPVPVSRVAATWEYDPYLWYRSGVSWQGYYDRTGRPLGARRDLDAFERASALEPGNPVYAAAVASTLGETGVSSARVRRAFDEALRLFPVSPDTHAQYADYLIMVGDIQGARSELDAVRWATGSIAVLAAELRYSHAVGDEPAAAALDIRLQEARRLASEWVAWP